MPTIACTKSFSITVEEPEGDLNFNNLVWTEIDRITGNPVATLTDSVAGKDFQLGAQQVAIGLGGQSAYLSFEGVMTVTCPETPANCNVIIASSPNNPASAITISINGVPVVDFNSSALGNGTFDLPFIVPELEDGLITVVIAIEGGGIFNAQNQNMTGLLTPNA